MSPSIYNRIEGKSYTLLCLLGFLIFNLFSCSHYNIATSFRSNNLRAYEGTLLPKNAVGYLFCASNNLKIAKINDTTFEHLKSQNNQEGSFTYIELLPGNHKVVTKGSTFNTSQRGFHTDLTIDISSQTVFMSGESELCFTVEPGHVYVIDGKIMKNKNKGAAGSSYLFSVFIKDTSTKEIVSRVDSEIKIHSNRNIANYLDFK